MKNTVITKLPQDFVLQAGGIIRGIDNQCLYNVDLLVRKGRICSIFQNGKPQESLGKKSFNKSLFSGISQLPKIERRGFFLIPALVNAHVHLELSHLKGKIKLNQGMAAFIGKIISLKKSSAQENHLKRAIREMVSSGTLLSGEVSNDLRYVNDILESPLEGIVFYELLGLDRQRVSEILRNARARFKEIDSQVKRINKKSGRLRWQTNFSAHAPYSLSFELQRRLSKLIFSPNRKVPSTIHMAESLDEISFLHGKRSPIAELYRKMKISEANPPVTWNDALEFWVRKGQILVHGTFFSERETKLLKKNGSGLVICPRSNLYITGGRAPVKLFMKMDLPIALGTDSLASNHDLNLFSEMRSCVDTYHVSPLDAFYFATRNGAKLLQREKDFGIIDNGYLAKWISVPLKIAQKAMPPNAKRINIKHLSIFFTKLLEIPVHPLEEVFY